MVIESNTNIAEKLLEDYRSNSKTISANSVSVLNDHRSEAHDLFEKTGFPTRRDEKYKYTNLKDIFEFPYSKNYTFTKSEVVLDDVFRCDVPELDTHIILLVNGWYPDTNQPLQKLEGNVIAGSLSEAAKQFPELVKKYYNEIEGESKCPVKALNTMFAQDGIFIHFPDNQVLEKPIQIINLLISDEPLMNFPRNLIIAGKRSEGKIIICDHTLSGQKFLTNSVTEVFCAEESTIDIYKMQNEHNDSVQIASSYITLKKGSVFNSNIITLHGGVVRNNQYVKLDDEHCEANLYGLTLADKNQHIDNYSFIDHAHPNCNSRELFKGLIDDQAVAVFNGKVLVRQDAQKTNSFQANHNILLTDEAKSYSRPQLEIYADDVKCSHGSTAGQLDKNALFYLKSRGISHREAMTMLMFAFACGVTTEIKIDALKDKIESLVDKRLRGEFSRCNHCVIRCC